MKRKKVLGILLVIVVLFLGIKYCSGQTSTDKLKEGDLIFHTSKSEQSPLIQYATMSVLSHCPLQDFINRGKGKQWWAKRVIDKPAKVKYSHLLGRRYDKSFKPDNNLFYCSELIHHIYLKQFGVELCKYRKVSSYHIIGLKKKLIQRGINLEQKVVAPIDIYSSKKAHSI